MKDKTKDIVLMESDAWQANKSSIPMPPSEYPEKAKLLIKAVENSLGLKERLLSFFEEYYHPFPNGKSVSTGYRLLALQDVWAFHKSNDTSKYIKIITELGIDTFNNNWSFHEKERILSSILGMFEKEVPAGFLDKDTCSELLLKLKPLIVSDDIFFARSSVKFHKLLKKILPQGAFQVIYDITKESLLTCNKVWNLDSYPVWRKKYSDLKLLWVVNEFNKKVKGINSKLTEKLSSEELLQIPDYEGLSRDILQQVKSDYPLVDKIQLLLSLFELPPFGFYRKEMLNHLTLILRKAPLESDSDQAKDIFSILFPFLRDLDQKHYVVTNSILLHLGKQIIPEGETQITDLLCKNILSIPFPDPKISGVNEDWQILRNPAHLPTIRTYLEIIKVAPEKTSLLLAGLHVNLREGGVFISDTDLFQSDVSGLLNSEIQPVYKQVKQLCRLFPVFFREIGAEGELRTSSTLIDELYHRKDKLIHFFRKQIHIESNNGLVDLLSIILKTWSDKNVSRLKQWVPQDVWEFLNSDTEYIEKAHNTIMVLKNVMGLKEPMELLNQDFEVVLDICKDGNLDIRVAHIIRLRALLVAKYDLDASGARDALYDMRFIENSEIEILFNYIDDFSFEKAIDKALDIMEGLKNIILDPNISKGDERIYRKRHIAAGIPSMYGSYQEKKLECLGATYRLERLITVLIEEMISGVDLDYITRPALRRIHWIMQRLTRALELDGIWVHEIQSNLIILDAAVKREGFSLGQFLNIFQVISERSQGVIDRYFFDFHKVSLSIIGKSRYNNEEERDKMSERVMREILSSAFGVGQMDSFMGTIISTLVDMRLKLSPEISDLILSYDADKALVKIHEVPSSMANAIWLGNKGYNLHMLRQFGAKVPWGFVITTEVYRCRKALESYPQMKAALRRRIIANIRTLEGLSGLTLGKSVGGAPPLLLSVRSGAAVSMPGVMTTFLNVGMNLKVVEELSSLPNFAWTAWDCYRRMIQIWGMTNGIDRDEFDAIIKDFKKKYGVTKKLEFSPANMAKVAIEYLELARRNGVFIPEDPLEQVIEAMELVFGSWDSDRAKVYREQFDLAEEWGTAVLIQRMILGNLNFDSGTGVAMTRIKGRDIQIYGDFVPNSQGEDVVSGLVHPFPISENDNTGDSDSISLEKSYPQHHRTLEELAKNLVIENDFSNQEIEFTFEDSNPENLYTLQCRTLISGHKKQVPVFIEEATKIEPLSMGMGSGGGAFVGRAVFDRDGIKKLLQEKKPDESLILIRPDTVPDDVDMIFNCGGLLTARGGITSHAAVTANRLAKVCVVNCRDMVVRDHLKEAQFGDLIIHEGDFISIDGKTGLIFEGKRKISEDKKAINLDLG